LFCWNVPEDGKVIGTLLEGGFRHSHILPSNYGSAPRANYDRLFCKYMRLVHHIFLEHGEPGIVALLELMCEQMHNSTYGYMAEASTRWLQRNISENFRELSLRDQDNCVIRAILDGNFGSLDTYDPVITHVHQVGKNILQMLACAGNKKQLLQLLETRFAPSNYQRTTAPLTEGMIKMTQDSLGEFTNTLLTLERAVEAHGAHLVPEPNVQSSTGAYAELGKSAQKQHKKKNSAAEFASRAEVQTIVKLYEAPPAGLQIKTTGNSLVTTAETTLDPKFLRFGQLLWAFHNTSGGLENVIAGSHKTFRKVLGIMLFGARGAGVWNAVFITEGRVKRDSSYAQFFVLF